MTFCSYAKNKTNSFLHPRHMCLSPFLLFARCVPTPGFQHLPFPRVLGYSASNVHMAYSLISCKSLFKCHLSKFFQNPTCKTAMFPDTTSLPPCFMALFSPLHYLTSSQFYFSSFLSVSTLALAVLFPTIFLVLRTVLSI